MKSSLEKLRKLARHKSDAKEKKDHQSSAQLDELAQASQDMQDMRSCYDSFLSAAAATANSAYEFSESLQEMGTCLLEKTASSAYGESGRVLLVLGKVQLELQKLVDSYRTHIIHTITNPSESLLSELRKVEEMKLQCDAKREVYEHMLAQYRDKGRLRSGKGENITSQQVKEALNECDDVARLCVFRVKSLKQGQCRSLLTQAARHHAAQLNFFRKGLKSLEGVDPQIKLVSENQHIDYEFVGLDDGEDGEGESMNSYGNNSDDGESSFDYRQNKLGFDNDCTSRISMELDQFDVLYPHSLKLEEAEITVSKNKGAQAFSRRPRPSSHSAPIYPDNFDPAERGGEVQPSVRKFHTYVLPTPATAKISASSTTSSGPQSSSTNLSTSTPNLPHSSPLRPEKRENSSNSSIPLPPPEGHSISQFDMHCAFDLNKNKRQAFSGPIPSKPWSTKPMLSTSGIITSREPPQLVVSRVRVSQPSSSPNVTHSVSPPLVSSPRIPELHELPRPPGSLASKPGNSSVIGHSAPLVIRNTEHSPTNRSPGLASIVASQLPAPPVTVPRSFSIPSSSQRAKALSVVKLLEPSQIQDKVEKVTSPPLMPISPSNMKSLSTVSEVASNPGLIRGGS